MSDIKKAHTTNEMLTSKMVVTYLQGVGKRGKTKKIAMSLTEGMVWKTLVVLPK